MNIVIQLLMSTRVQPRLDWKTVSCSEDPNNFKNFTEIILRMAMHVKEKLTVSTISSFFSKFAWSFTTFSTSNLQNKCENNILMTSIFQFKTKTFRSITQNEPKVILHCNTVKDANNIMIPYLNTYSISLWEHFSNPYLRYSITRKLAKSKWYNKMSSNSQNNSKQTIIFNYLGFIALGCRM